ncbi:MAG: hypothetical protein GXO78_09065 [Calditrichaeota bacterium]|nr:hypothetical protein [Calditrichota bacterium]
MIETYFPELTRLPGVEAVVLFDNQKKVRDQWTIPQFNTTIIPELAESYIQIFGVSDRLKEATQEVVVPFERGILFARNLEKFVIVIVARLSVEISLLRLILEVRVPDFLEDRKIAKMGKRIPASKFDQINEFSLDEKEVNFIQQLTGTAHGGKEGN